MKIELELWHLILLLLAFFGACSGAGKMLLTQTEKNLDARFTAQELGRTSNHDQLSKRLDSIESANVREASNWQRMERELLILKAELPLYYVRRDDYVQAVAAIMVKLDGMSMKFENILLRGAKNHE